MHTNECLQPVGVLLWVPGAFRQVGKAVANTFHQFRCTSGYSKHPPNVPLLKALWSLGYLKGQVRDAGSVLVFWTSRLSNSRSPFRLVVESNSWGPKDHVNKRTLRHVVS